MEDSLQEQVEQAETKLMRDMAFMKMQHQQLVEQLKNNYNTEVRRRVEKGLISRVQDRLYT